MCSSAEYWKCSEKTLKMGSQVHGKASPGERHRCTACSFCRGTHMIFSYKILMQSDIPKAHTLLGSNPHCSAPCAAAQASKACPPLAAAVTHGLHMGFGSQSKVFPPAPFLGCWGQWVQGAMLSRDWATRGFRAQEIRIISWACASSLHTHQKNLSDGNLATYLGRGNQSHHLFFFLPHLWKPESHQQFPSGTHRTAWDRFIERSHPSSFPSKYRSNVLLTWPWVCFAAALAVIAWLAHGDQQNAAHFPFWDPDFRRQGVSSKDFAARFSTVGRPNRNKSFNPIKSPGFTGCKQMSTKYASWLNDA